MCQPGIWWIFDVLHKFILNEILPAGQPLQARAIGETELIRCAYDWRESEDEFQLWNFDHNYGFYGMEENEGLRFIFTIAIVQGNVVVGSLDDITPVDATRHALDIHELSFIPAKQIFRMLSFHSKAQAI